MSHTIIHLVRHGEVYNPDRILYGRIPDYHLSARGQSMAAATAQSFANHDIALLWSSPLERAQETAGPISETTGVDITLDDPPPRGGGPGGGAPRRPRRAHQPDPLAPHVEPRASQLG